MTHYRKASCDVVPITDHEAIIKDVSRIAKADLPLWTELMEMTVEWEDSCKEEGVLVALLMSKYWITKKGKPMSDPAIIEAPAQPIGKNEAKCETCFFVAHFPHPRQPKKRWWSCTYRPPATMRVFDVDAPLTIGDEPLRAKASLSDMEITPDDWCDQWKKRDGPIAHFRSHEDGVFFRYPEKQP